MKKLFWIILFGIMVIGFTGAQDPEFGFQNTAPNFSLGSLDFNNDLRLDLLASGGRKPIVGVPILAGLMNIPLGLWSWVNQDWLGGGITAGAQIGGIVIGALAVSGGNIGMAFASWGLFLGGTIYGVVRGSSQCRKMNSGIAWTGDPLDHITAVAYPTAEGRWSGALTFQTAF
jgi:hypothetical protein